MENYDYNIEVNVLGNLLSEDAKESIPRVRKVFGNLGRNVFYSPDNRLIYQAILDLNENGQAIHPDLLSPYLKEKLKAEISAGQLVLLKTNDQGIGLTEHFAKKLKELAVRREVKKVGQEIVQGIEGDKETSSLIDETKETLAGLEKESAEEKKGMNVLESLDTPITQSPSPIEGGLLVADRYMILAAVDGEGKTTWCIQLALCACTGTTFLGRFPIPKPVKVLYFCGENSRGDFNDKLAKQISALEEILGRKIKKEELRNFTFVEPVHIDFVLDKKDDIPILYYWMEKYKPIIVIFDPLTNFVSNDESLNTDTIARKTASALNKLARDFNCFPIITTHFKKESEIEPSSIFDRFHGSGYWTKPAVSKVAMTRAHEKRSPHAKKFHFDCKTVPEMSPMLMLRDRDNLWLNEVTTDELSKAKLIPKDLVQVLERRCNGQSVPSIFEEIAAEDLGCSQRQIRELMKVAKEKGLIVKEGGLLRIPEILTSQQENLKFKKKP